MQSDFAGYELKSLTLTPFWFSSVQCNVHFTGSSNCTCPCHSSIREYGEGTDLCLSASVFFL
jgi:hypothetical protein